MAIAFALLVSAAGDDTGAEFEYIDTIQAQSMELARAGDAFRDVLSRLQRLGRDEFVTVIESVSRDIETGLAFVEGEPPTERYESVRSVYKQALVTWQSGITGYRDAVLLAADQPQSFAVTDVMASALAEIRAGDSLYADLVEVMASPDLPQPPAPMVAVTLMPAGGNIWSLAGAYIDSARSPNNELALRPGLAVAMVTSDPAWQVDISNQAVIPATNSVVFSVVINNKGNVASVVDQLVITLTGGSEPVRQQISIDPLEPGQQVTIVAEAVDVVPGGVYEVAAALAISENDSDFSDNMISVQFTINDE